MFLVGRDEERNRAALDLLRSETSAELRCFTADLASQQAVRVLAEQLGRALIEDDLAVGALVHSAGVYSSRRVVTADRVELTMAVNHLAPFLLTHELLPLLVRSAPTRVLVVSSNSHRGASLDPDRFANPPLYNGLRAYQQSKLANVLFVRELSRRVERSGIGAFAVDPGLVNTMIGAKHSGAASRIVWQCRRRLGTTPDVPARPIAALANATIGTGESGTYWKDGRQLRPGARALDDGLALALWHASCDQCGIPDWPDSPSLTAR